LLPELGGPLGDLQRCDQFLTFSQLVFGVLLSTAVLANLNPPAVRLALLRPGWWRQLNDVCMTWFDLERNWFAREAVVYLMVSCCYQVAVILEQGVPQRASTLLY